MSTQELLALKLAMDHALVCQMDMRTAIKWSGENWKVFIDQTTTEQADDYVRELDEDERQCQELEFQGRLLVGPQPADDAPEDDHVSYQERVEAEVWKLLLRRRRRSN